MMMLVMMMMMMEDAHTRIHTHTHMHTYIYIYICMKHTNINYFNVSIYILYTYILCIDMQWYSLSTQNMCYFAGLGTHVLSSTQIPIQPFSSFGPRRSIAWAEGIHETSTSHPVNTALFKRSGMSFSEDNIFDNVGFFRNVINHPPVISIAATKTIPKWMVYDSFNHIIRKLELNIWIIDCFLLILFFHSSHTFWDIHLLEMISSPSWPPRACPNGCLGFPFVQAPRTSHCEQHQETADGFLFEVKLIQHLSDGKMIYIQN